MKFLKKATLAAAIIAAPFAAQAELKAMDDAALSATTGQAGVDIDITLAGGGTPAVSVGSVTYKDEGFVGIDTLTLGSATGADITINQQIDVDANGDVIMVTGAVNGLRLGIDSVDLYASSATVSDIADGTATANGSSLVSDLTMDFNLGQSTTVIRAANDAAEATAAGADLIINNTSSIQITDLDVDALGGKVGIKDVTFSNNGGAATLTQAIWANDNGLNIQVQSISGDLTVGAIELGGASIGSVSVSDITLAGVTTTIAGK